MPKFKAESQKTAFLTKNNFLKIFLVTNIVILYFYHILHEKVEKGTILRFLKFSTVFDVGPFQNSISGLATRFFDFKML